jgi:hypothetical protein
MTPIIVTMNHQRDLTITAPDVYTQILHVGVPEYHDPYALIDVIKQLARDIRDKGGRINYYGVLSGIRAFAPAYEHDYRFVQAMFKELVEQAQAIDGQSVDIVDMENEQTALGRMKTTANSILEANYAHQPVNIMTRITDTTRRIQQGIEQKTDLSGYEFVIR